ncbi:MAG: hypothetical protein JWR16_1614 [Nevskia sp.]|nr:hypothetical protein [Nevskia sp.]
MKYGLWGSALLVAGIWAGQAAALNTDGYDIPYVGISGLYEFPDSKREADIGYGGRAWAGYPLTENSAFELSYFMLQRKRDIDGKHDFNSGLLLDYIYDFGLFAYEQKWLPDFKPYLLSGAGVERDDERGNVHYNPALEAGAGLMFPLKVGNWNWGWSLRTEARVLAAYNDHDFPNKRVPFDVHLNAGLNIPLTWFFKPSHKQTDLLDCPTAVVDPVTGRSDCAADSDGDGVTDTLDQCPGTPAGTPVDEKGCPIENGADDDHDGVLNGADECPHTPAGVKVDAKGCAVAQTVVLDDVNFELNSAILTGQATHVLDGVAQALNAQQNIKVEIAGHTDNSGSPKYNLVLSQQRAESVRQYLVGRSVDMARMTPKGFGETQPLVSNDTENGRAANRRVEFKIVLQ